MLHSQTKKRYTAILLKIQDPTIAKAHLSVVVSTLLSFNFYFFLSLFSVRETESDSQLVVAVFRHAFRAKNIEKVYIPCSSVHNNCRHATSHDLW